MQGIYQDVEECLAESPVPADCACGIFGGEQGAEITTLLSCLKDVDQQMLACVTALTVCGNPQQCTDIEAQGFVQCGFIPKPVCMALSDECGEPGPLGQCASS